MTRKIGGFLAFATTGLVFLGTIIVRQEQVAHTLIAVVLVVLAGAALKDHYTELKG